MPGPPAAKKTTTTRPANPRVLVELEALPSPVPLGVRLKKLLKMVGRYGFRCRWAKEVE